MKNLLLILILALSIITLSNTETKASHAYGGEMSYTHLPLPGSPWRYRLNVFFYRYCGTGSIAEPATWPLVTATPSGCTGGGTPVTSSLTKVLNVAFPFIPVWRKSGDNVVATCPNYPNSCVDQSAAFKTNQIWIYESIILLNAQCNSWVFCSFLNARNGDITNLTGPGGLNLVFTAMLNNSPGVITLASLNAPTNARLNSPYLRVIPTPAAYVNQRFDASLGVVDFDGDSLAFSKDVPFTACPSTAVPFNPGFTFQEPIATIPGTGGFKVDTELGQMTFTPSAIGKYVACIRASKYRNGALAGYVRRDIQIDVRASISPSAPPLFPNLPPNSNPLISGINGTDNYKMIFRACETTCYTIYATDPNQLNRLQMSFNDTAIFPAGANYTLNITNLDQPSATICWTPDPAHIRNWPYILSAVVRDDYPISGEQSYAYGMYVTPGNFASAGQDVTKCAGAPVGLQATGGGPGASYTWSPATGLSNPNSPTPIADPFTNQCYTVTIQNTNGCVAVDTVCVNVVTSQITTQINFGADTVNMCIGDSVQLIASGGFIYDWSTATPGLSRYDIPNPMASPTTTTTYTVSVSSGPTNNLVVNAFSSIGSNLFAGTLDGGVFVSSNNGVQWTKMNTGLTNTAILSMSVIGGSLYAGTNGGGIFVFNNTPGTWSPLNNGLVNLTVNSIFANGGNIYVATNGGVFVSSNSGGLWTSINTGLTSLNVTSLALYGTGLVAGTDSGVFITTNNGISWNTVSTGLTTIFVSALLSTGGNLFAGTASGGVFFYVDDTLASWVPVNTGLTNFFINSLTSSGSSIYAGTNGGIFVSVNSGSSWSAINTGLSSLSVNQVFVNGGDLFAGTINGAYYSNNAGLNWGAINGGLTNLCTSEASIVVFVDNPISTSLPNDTTICRGANVQLDATGGQSYFWTPNYNISNPFSPTPIVNPLRTTLYKVRALSGFGCYAEDSINVFVNSSSAPEITVTPKEHDKTFCLGDSQIYTVQFSTPVLIDCGPNPGVNSVCAAGPINATLGNFTTPPSSILPTYNRQGRGTKQQYLIRKNELLALGMGEGDIKSLSFYTSSVPAGADSLVSMTIRLKCVDTTFQYQIINGSYYFTTDTDPVYRRTAYLPTLGQNTHTFDIPYYWPGDKHLLVEICYLYNGPLSGPGGPQYGMLVTTPMGYITTLSIPSANADNSAVCTNCRIQASSNSQVRPVMTFEGCNIGINSYSYVWSGLTPLAQSFIDPFMPDSLTTVIVPTQTGTFQYRVDVIDTFGCSNFLLDSIIVLDSLSDLQLVYPEAGSYCNDDTLLLLATSTTATGYDWSASLYPNAPFPYYSDFIDTITKDTLIYDIKAKGRSGLVKFQVVANNQNQCSRTDSVIVRLGPPLNAVNKGYPTYFENDPPVNPDEFIFTFDDYLDKLSDKNDLTGKRIVEVVPFEVTFLNLSENLDSVWRWSLNKDGSGEIIFSADYTPKFTFNDDGDYLITLYAIDSSFLTDVNNPPRYCDATDTLRVIAEAFTIPNTITPNGDGLNDVFRVRGLKRGFTSKLEVYNRWGRPVFVMDNYDNSFDGRDLPSGPYFFNFYYSETEKNYTGFIQILKD